MPNTAAELLGCSAQLSQRGEQLDQQFVQVVGSAVGEFPFGQRPNTLVGIQFRSVGWEVLGAQTGMPPLQFVQQTSLVSL